MRILQKMAAVDFPRQNGPIIGLFLTKEKVTVSNTVPLRSCGPGTDDVSFLCFHHSFRKEYPGEIVCLTIDKGTCESAVDSQVLVDTVPNVAGHGYNASLPRDAFLLSRSTCSAAHCGPYSSRIQSASASVLSLLLYHGESHTPLHVFLPSPSQRCLLLPRETRLPH